jgi:hypothetical protein
LRLRQQLTESLRNRILYCLQGSETLLVLRCGFVVLAIFVEGVSGSCQSGYLGKFLGCPLLHAALLQCHLQFQQLGGGFLRGFALVRYLRI